MVKKIIILGIFLLFSSFLSAYPHSDTAIVRKHVIVLPLKNIRNPYKTHKVFRGHWQGFHFGFTHTNVSYPQPLYTENEVFMDTDWGKSHVMQFNIKEWDFALNSKGNCGMITGIGIEYQRFAFNNLKTKLYTEDDVLRGGIHNGVVNIRRNSLKNFYMILPLIFEYHIEIPMQRKLYFSAGCLSGIKLHSKTKIVYKAKGKKHKIKDRDDFSQQDIKIDAYFQMGLDKYKLWAAYCLTPMFKKDKGPKVKKLSIGLGFSF